MKPAPGVKYIHEKSALYLYSTLLQREMKLSALRSVMSQVPKSGLATSAPKMEGFRVERDTFGELQVGVMVN